MTTNTFCLYTGPKLCGIKGEHSQAFNKVIFCNIDPYNNDANSDVINNSTASSIHKKCEEFHTMRCNNPTDLGIGNNISLGTGIYGYSPIRDLPGLRNLRLYTFDPMHCFNDQRRGHILPSLKGLKSYRYHNNNPNEVAPPQCFLSKRNCQTIDTMYDMQ